MEEHLSFFTDAISTTFIAFMLHWEIEVIVLQIYTIGADTYTYIHIVVFSLTLIKTILFGSGHVFQLKLLQQNTLNWWIFT